MSNVPPLSLFQALFLSNNVLYVEGVERKSHEMYKSSIVAVSSVEESEGLSV